MVFDKVTEIIKEILDENGIDSSKEIKKETELRDLGLTSFDLATLTVMIEDEYDIDIFEDGIVHTIGDITDKIENK